MADEYPGWHNNDGPRRGQPNQPLGSKGPAHTRGEMEPPQGERDMGGWWAAVYTDEQQQRVSPAFLRLVTVSSRLSVCANLTVLSSSVARQLGVDEAGSSVAQSVSRDTMARMQQAADEATAAAARPGSRPTGAASAPFATCVVPSSSILEAQIFRTLLAKASRLIFTRVLSFIGITTTAQRRFRSVRGKVSGPRLRVRRHLGECELATHLSVAKNDRHINPIATVATMMAGTMISRSALHRSGHLGTQCRQDHLRRQPLICTRRHDYRLQQTRGQRLRRPRYELFGPSSGCIPSPFVVYHQSYLYDRLGDACVAGEECRRWLDLRLTAGCNDPKAGQLKAWRPRTRTSTRSAKETDTTAEGRCGKALTADRKKC